MQLLCREQMNKYQACICASQRSGRHLCCSHSLLSLVGRVTSTSETRRSVRSIGPVHTRTRSLSSVSESSFRSWSWSSPTCASSARHSASFLSFLHLTWRPYPILGEVKLRWVWRLSWRRSWVIGTLVFGRRTFTDLCPIYDWQMTTLLVKCPL